MAKAIYDNKLLDCFFTRSFYKHILGKPVHFTDLESFDYSFYQGLQYLLDHDLSDIGMELTFSTEVIGHVNLCTVVRPPCCSLSGLCQGS